MNSKSLLIGIDAAINLILGILLLVFPGAIVEALGVPKAESPFYPSILGAVLFGIGIALLIQLRSTGGLGLAGAVAINLCGGLALAGWLIFGSLSLSLQGQAFLWGLVIVLVGISIVELFAHGKRKAA